MKIKWQIKKIENSLQNIPKLGSLLRSDYLREGKFPVIDQGQDFIAGYTNDESLIFKDCLPVIIFGDHTRALKFVDFPFAVGADGTKILKPIDEFDPMFFYYVLESLELGSRGYARHFKLLKEQEIPLPPLETQKEIVAKLDEKFAKLKEAKNLRKKAFADTEKILAQTLRGIFQEGKQKGWEELFFGNEKYLKIIDGDRGKNYPTKSEFASEGYCLFLSTSNVRKGYFDFTRMDFISKEKDQSLRKGKVSRGDVILTTRGTLGNSAFYDNYIPYDNIRINSGMLVLRPDQSRVLSQYIIYIINSNEFIKKIQEANSGSAQPQLPIKVLSNLSFPLPPLSEQLKIVTKLDKLSEKIRELRELQKSQLEDMKKLEKAYLREAFQGELI